MVLTVSRLSAILLGQCTVPIFIICPNVRPIPQSIAVSIATDHVLTMYRPRTQALSRKLHSAVVSSIYWNLQPMDYLSTRPLWQRRALLP